MKKIIIIFIYLTYTLTGYSQKDNSNTTSANGQNGLDTAEINQLIIKAQVSQSKNETEAALNNALFAYNKSLAINYSYGLSKSLESIFSAYYSKSDYKNALTYELKYLELAEKEKNKSHEALAYKKMAVIYQEQQHLFNSLSYYNQSYRIFLTLADSENIAGVLTNKGLNYYQLSHDKTNAKYKIYFDSAVTDLNASLKISRNNNYPKVTAANLGNLAEIYTTLKEYETALNYSLESIDNFKKNKDISGEAISYYEIGNIYEAKADRVKSIENYQKSLKLAKEAKNKYLESYCYNALATELSRIGDYKLAFTYQKLHSDTKDSLINVEDMRQITEMETKYETEKKEALNKLLTDQNILSTQTIKQQKIINYFIAGVLIMALIFSFLIFNGLKKQRNANVIISKQKEDVELKSSEIEKQKHLVEEKQKSILDSIHYAKRIQSTILPHEDVINSNLPHNFVFYKPKDIVSGDFYWATYHREAFYIAVCDSTGHGVPGAFMSILSIGFLSEAINEKDVNEPHEIFNYVRERLVNSISKDGQRDGFDGILMRFDKKTNKVTYAAANNGPVLTRDNKCIDLPKDKMPVGKGEKQEDFTLHSIDLQKGDSIYLYTDGYADQFGGPNSKKFMYKQLQELLLAGSVLPMEEQKNNLYQKFVSWQGNLEQVDDVLVIGIKI